MFKIDKNIPVPVGGSGTSTIYPFAKMKVGDSFLVSNADRGLHNRARAAASQHGRRYKMKFITRMMDNGLRVWRVK